MATGRLRHLLLLDHTSLAVRVPVRTAFAMGVAAAALALVGLLVPLLGRPYYFVAFAAITASAVVAGTRYGVLTTLTFGAGYLYWFLEPYGSFTVAQPRALAGLVGYSLTGLFVAWVGGSLRHAFARLEAQSGALERLQEQREDLLRSLTHDLRTPLSVIGLNAQLLERTPGVDPEVVRRAAVIERNVAAAAAMTEDLVEVAKLESGHVALAREPVDVARLAAGLPERLPGHAASRRIRVDVGPGVPPLDADPRRLERVLVNLLANALKYAPGESQVTLRAVAGAGEVTLEVADEGPGIAERDLPHVFDKYYRAEPSRAKEGLGLGLYISRLLVEAHGGRIWATSAEGGGSTFHVALPAARP